MALAAFGRAQGADLSYTRLESFAPAPPELELAARKILTDRKGEFAVAFRDLETGEMLLINSRRRMHAASTMKVAVMMAAFEMIDEGEWTLETPVKIHNTFKSIVDGSDFKVEVDNDGSLYRRLGQTRPLGEIITLVITRSSNLGTNLLVERMGVDRINRLARRMGAENTVILRGVEDIKAYREGLNNETDALDMLRLVSACRESLHFRPASRAKMMEILAAQTKNEMIPSGLTGGEAARVAHKTGAVSQAQHDAAIVELPSGRSFALVILSRDFGANRQGAIEGGRKIARLLYDHVAARETGIGQ